MTQIKHPRRGPPYGRSMGEVRAHENELLPLSLAASLAYFELTEVTGEAGSEEHLRGVVDLTAIALSHVAPVYSGTGASVMSPAQVQQLLFAPIREGRQAPDLDRFYIRRRDLHAAIIILRTRADAWERRDEGAVAVGAVCGEHVSAQNSP